MTPFKVYYIYNAAKKITATLLVLTILFPVLRDFQHADGWANVALLSMVLCGLVFAEGAVNRYSNKLHYENMSPAERKEHDERIAKFLNR